MALFWLQLKSFFFVIVNVLLTLVLFPYYLVMFLIGRPAKMILVGRHMRSITNMYKDSYGQLHKGIKDKVFGGDKNDK